MNSPVQSAPRHVWQYGHVGEHRQLGLVTVFNIEDPSSGFISDETPRIITFINAIGTPIDQRDNGNDPLDVTFRYDSGYQVDQSGDPQFTGAYKYAFEQGLFNDPASNAPAAATEPAAVVSVDVLIEKLRVDNPTAKITSVPFADDSTQKVQLVVAAPKLKLTLSHLVESSVVDLDINRSGSNAVVTFTVNALQS